MLRLGLGQNMFTLLAVMVEGEGEPIARQTDHVSKLCVMCSSVHVSSLPAWEFMPTGSFFRFPLLNRQIQPPRKYWGSDINLEFQIDQKQTAASVVSIGMFGSQFQNERWNAFSEKVKKDRASGLLAQPRYCNSYRNKARTGFANNASGGNGLPYREWSSQSPLFFPVENSSYHSA